MSSGEFLSRLNAAREQNRARTHCTHAAARTQQHEGSVALCFPFVHTAFLLCSLMYVPPPGSRSAAPGSS